MLRWGGCCDGVGVVLMLILTTATKASHMAVTTTMLALLEGQGGGSVVMWQQRQRVPPCPSGSHCACWSPQLRGAHWRCCANLAESSGACACRLAPVVRGDCSAQCDRHAQPYCAMCCKLRAELCSTWAASRWEPRCASDCTDKREAPSLPPWRAAVG